MNVHTGTITDETARRELMSPRKNNVFIVKAWPILKGGKLYNGTVRKAHADKEAQRIHVAVEHLDTSQLGRIHEFDLPLPIRPGNRTCAFLSACGIDASTIGTKICIDDIIDTVIGMKFGLTIQDGSQHIYFESIEEAAGTQTAATVEESVTHHQFDQRDDERQSTLGMREKSG